MPAQYTVEDRGYTTPCWIWQGGTDTTGYGVINRNRKFFRAHRWFYEQACGPIPTGLQLDHLCRNKLCVNPDHLEPVTNRENFLRGVHPKAIACRTNTCLKGHPLTEENTRWDGGNRRCRICRNEWRRKNYRHRRYSE